jgi:glutamine---fructose-6-phosphate transaminase (isomerizing)
MCGIVGIAGKHDAAPVILEALKRLEYRGYDSSGIATLVHGEIERRRAPGKLSRLGEVLRERPLAGHTGIGHTRWATHGRPTEENAHPHRDCSGEIVVVHNGIIENYLKLKHQLTAEGHKFVTETDTEIIAHLIEKFSKAGSNLEASVMKAVKVMTGAYALVAISTRDPQKIVAARLGPPIVVGLGENEYFVASDIPAILQHTRSVVFLADGDIAILTPAGVKFTDFDGKPLSRPPQHITWDPIMAEKGGYKHFMQKEIFEQPRAVRDTLIGRISQDTGTVFLDDMDITPEEFRKFESIKLIACGTSWHAALAGKFMIERIAQIPVEVDYGSEFRYRDPIVDKRDLVIAISQSGETADTLAAMREAAQKGGKILGICNVVGSMLTRDAKGTVYTHAGPEIGVASTKAFTCQLTALLLTALYLGQARGKLAPADNIKLMQELTRLPQKIEEVLQRDPAIEALARLLFRHTDFLYLGRGIHYPIALEGALKLKEISYIHAEGYPAGEMKHGPNALIDENLPVVVIATRDENDPASMTRYEKTISNMQEVAARDGIVIAIVTEGDKLAKPIATHVIEISHAPELLTPILEIVPLQLLAYHIAVRRGCDVDQPRNLAKSVTVE